MFKTLYYVVILILFRMGNLNNTSYVIIVDNVIIMLVMISNGETLVTYSIQMYVVKYVQKGVEKVNRRVKLIIILLLCPSCLLNNLYQH